MAASYIDALTWVTPMVVATVRSSAILRRADALPEYGTGDHFNDAEVWMHIVLLYMPHHDAPLRHAEAVRPA